MNIETIFRIISITALVCSIVCLVFVYVTIAEKIEKKKQKQKQKTKKNKKDTTHVSNTKQDKSKSSKPAIGLLSAVVLSDLGDDKSPTS
jgi:predicted tellurium resistance membrane protein TerC